MTEWADTVPAPRDDKWLRELEQMQLDLLEMRDPVTRELVRELTRDTTDEISRLRKAFTITIKPKG